MDSGQEYLGGGGSAEVQKRGGTHGVSKLGSECEHHNGSHRWPCAHAGVRAGKWHLPRNTGSQGSLSFQDML